MKSGTSSLHRYLQQHPTVSASKPKELDFFTHQYGRGLSWYLDKFGDGLAGEASPNYMKAHMWPDTAKRIRDTVPGARLVGVLRNPIDRTLSHYLHNVIRGREKRPFSRAVTPTSNIVRTSCYGWQLDHYLAHFPPEQLMLITTEELDRHPELALRQILRFIGADDNVPIDTSQRHNVTARRLAEADAAVPADPELIIGADQITLAPPARARLADIFRPDIDLLRSTWPQFPVWSL
jgi:hypothetical protein